MYFPCKQKGFSKKQDPKLRPRWPEREIRHGHLCPSLYAYHCVRSSKSQGAAIDDRHSASFRGPKWTGGGLRKCLSL